MALGASLHYTPETVKEYGEGVILLATTMPVRLEPYAAVDTRYFLEGLLPEAEVRAVLAARARVGVADVFGLLRAYGLDCAGAVQVVPAGSRPRTPPGRVRWLGEADLAAAIRDLPTAPLGVGVDDGVRASLGGVQGKLPVVVDGPRMGVPADGAPSTHILKPAKTNDDGSEQWPGIVAAEAFGLRIIAEAGRRGALVRGATCRPMSIGDRQVLMVTRFDRRVSATGVVERVHQEDLTQALGILDKYQHSDTLPPSWRDVDGLLSRVATVPALARRALLEMIVANTVLGNCDFHAKNVSIVLDRGRLELAPAYDVVPTSVWKRHSRELALRVGGETHLDDVTRESLFNETSAWGMRRAAAMRVIDEMLGRVGESVSTVLNEARTEGWCDPVLDEIASQTSSRILQLSG